MNVSIIHYYHNKYPPCCKNNLAYAVEYVLVDHFLWNFLGNKFFCMNEKQAQKFRITIQKNNLDITRPNGGLVKRNRLFRVRVLSVLVTVVGMSKTRSLKDLNLVPIPT
jgi:hypothetical protein